MVWIWFNYACVHSVLTSMQSFAEAFYPVSDSEGVFYQSELPLPSPPPPQTCFFLLV